jgi:hypothetical protein
MGIAHLFSRVIAHTHSLDFPCIYSIRHEIHQLVNIHAAGWKVVPVKVNAMPVQSGKACLERLRDIFRARDYARGKIARTLI